MASPSPDAASSDAATPPASVDLYRDTPVRFLGYANELGESFKPLIPRVAYFGTYGVACAYVAADANDKYERDGDVARGVDALFAPRRGSAPNGLARAAPARKLRLRVRAAPMRRETPRPPTPTPIS